MKKLLFAITVMVSMAAAASVSSCTLFSSLGLTSKGLPIKEAPDDLATAPAVTTAVLDHSLWTELLREYVDEEGNVDYKRWKKNRGPLDSYLDMLSKNPPQEEWPVQELLAYYINVYNAYTVDLILEHYPVKSIKDISRPFTRAFIPIGDTEMSLAGIENSILREMNEPRMHFAINCASISCPKLRREAYVSTKIDAQLEAAARDFINSDKNIIQPDHLQLNKIFDWYRKDYTVNGKASLPRYVDQFTDIKIQPDPKITFLEYDWGLNEQK